jgi:hypothetical protein
MERTDDMRRTLTALALVALATTSYAAVEIASSPDKLCLPSAIHHIQVLS